MNCTELSLAPVMLGSGAQLTARTPERMLRKIVSNRARLPSWRDAHPLQGGMPSIGEPNHDPLETLWEYSIAIIPRLYENNV